MNLDWFSEKRNKNKLFWSLQFLFWFIHWLAIFLMAPEYYINNPKHFTNFSVLYVPLIVSSLLLRFVYKKYRVHRKHLLKIIAIVLSISVVCGSIYYLSAQVLAYYIYGGFYFQKFLMNPVNEIWQDSYVFGVWSAIYLGFKIYEELIEQRQNTERAISLAQSAQLEMLRYQLNPHFLFNTLSSLRALIRRKDNDIAEEMVTKISEFLKYSLLEGEDNKVPLSREIKIIKHYFDIEKVRFKEQLDVEYDIDPLTENVLIPVFLIHPLIENAVKHGMKTSPSPLRISIKTQMINGNLHIDLINSGEWIERSSDESTTRTGLQNTMRRLELAYAENHSIEILKENSSVHIKIIIKRIK